MNHISHTARGVVVKRVSFVNSVFDTPDHFEASTDPPQEQFSGCVYILSVIFFAIIILLLMCFFHLILN